MVVDVGLTEMLAPVPTCVPPQLPEYHSHDAPVPREPPERLNVVELPLQIVEGLADALVAATESEFTTIVFSVEYSAEQPPL